MRLDVRGKLFLVSVLLVLSVVLVAGGYLEGQIREWAHGRAEAELLAQARVARVALAYDNAPADAVADQLGAASGARVTIIDRSGKVLGDSEIAADELATVDSHSDRPEVMAAVAEGEGRAVRYSATLGTDMMYIAVPFTAGAVTGTVRIARPLEEMDAAVRRLRIALGIAGLLSLAGAVVLSGLASHFLARTLRTLVEDARRAVDGEEPRAPTEPSDEPGMIGSLNRMAAELETTVGMLAAERSRFEAVLESMDEGVVAVDQVQSLTLINRAALGLLSLSIEHGGSTLAERIPIPALHELVQRALAGQPERREFETRTTPPRQVLAYACPLRNQQGAVVVMHDVTEIRRLERVRRDFVANVSHELRTPVSIIRANAETLLDGAIEKPEVARRFLDAQLRSADRLAALVADLLEISRIEAGTYEMSPDEIELEPIVAHTIDEVERLAQEKHIEVTSDVPEDMTVWADEQALEQVLLNLIDNAVKYTPAGGKIVVRAKKRGDMVRIEVEDNGPGIEARHRARVFERFYRVDKGRSREVGGTGLGLAIVKHLAEAMEGQVGVEPAEPQGSLFWLTLPAASD
ncbi:ATP-binding protein [Nannocystis sp. ILAH1]|uniref:sensor histidine kinase n=1 Tax=unclassified Nannocystis TaxID=2627009 RepID=UPI00226DC6DA|nr:ATP-binding protein [Nannocystis sp. ILAH1]MCY1063358.1 ATP-binding protein [Nannocystis sp. RBIL2]